MPGDAEGAAPGLFIPAPGVVELCGPMLVALFMLLGPLAEEGEPAEFGMPAPPPVPMPDGPPVEVAWDGLALAAAEPGPPVPRS